jgi:hypothetical protein
LVISATLQTVYYQRFTDRIKAESFAALLVSLLGEDIAALRNVCIGLFEQTFLF